MFNDYVNYIKKRSANKCYFFSSEEMEKHFNYCLNHNTWFKIDGTCTIRNEEKSLGVTKIFLEDETLCNKSNIINYYQSLYNENPLQVIEEHLFHCMFCDLEWLTRCKNDFAKEYYKKVFK